MEYVGQIEVLSTYAFAWSVHTSTRVYVAHNEGMGRNKHMARNEQES